jgi:hypothetical protein
MTGSFFCNNGCCRFASVDIGFFNILEMGKGENEKRRAGGYFLIKMDYSRVEVAVAVRKWLMKL